MYDRQIKISMIKSRKATSLTSVSMLWSELVKKLQNPIRGEESIDEYLSLPKSKQDDLKDVGGFVGGTFRGNRRKLNDLVGRDVLTLDLDNIPPGATDEVLKNVEASGYAHVIYSTRKHTPLHPRLRVLMPLSRTATPDEYEPVVRKIASYIGLEMCDPTTFEASRLMYWPSCSKDAEYIYVRHDGEMADVDEILGEYEDWRDVKSWLGVLKAKDVKRKQGVRQSDPRGKRGIVGAFCRAYDVPSAIEKFISEAYEPAGDGRYTFTGGSTTSGAVLYDDGQFLYSHHATDPAGGRLCNAFDLVRLHKFSHLDEKIEDSVQIYKLPSYGEMFKLVTRDPEVLSSLIPQSDFSKGEEVSDLRWRTKLEIGTSGKIERTIDNVVVILENDPLLSEKFAYDEFASKAFILGELPWDSRCEKRWWSKSDSQGLRHYLESRYRIIGKDRIDDAVGLVMHRHKYNDVQDYLRGLRWDERRRVDTLLSDYLGAKDTEYTRAVMRKSLVAAVARALNPGCKYDYTPIFVGPQGIGKSTFLKLLAKEWYSDSLQTFEGREAAEMIQGVWINELGELAGLSRAETNKVKQFLTRSEDIFRVPYGESTDKFPRKCVFFGTTNDAEFLKDKTGNRRFWPVDVGICVPTKSVFTDLEGEVDQIWAEAVVLWKSGESTYLTGDLINEATKEQELHKEIDPKEGMIINFVDRKIPRDWHSRSIDQRIIYWNANCEMPDLIERDRICAAEIWCECLGQPLAKLKRSDTVEINAVLSSLSGWEKHPSPYRFGPYGMVRGGYLKI